MKTEHEQSQSEAGGTLAAFRQEMADYAAREASGEVESGHFLASGTTTREQNPDFNVSKLTEEDFNMWKAIGDGTVSMEEFHRYANGVSGLDAADPTRRSRMIFSDFAGNVLLKAILEKEIEE
jgi:hypothetical protein